MSQNSAFLSSDSENEDFEEIANPRTAPVLTALLPPMHQQMPNASAAIPRQFGATPQAPGSTHQAMYGQSFPAGIPTALAPNLPQSQPAPLSENAWPPGFAGNGISSQFSMVRTEPDFSEAEAQMPNGNRMQNPDLIALSTPLHQQMPNSLSAIPQQVSATPQAPGSAHSTTSCQWFPAGIPTAPTPKLPQSQQAPLSNNPGPPIFANNGMPSQFPMVSPQPGFPSVETPQLPLQAQQVPNGSMMGFMQDPNFMQQMQQMQQMMLLMQQMQLQQAQQPMVQQNGGYNPNPTFQGNGVPQQGIQQLPQPPSSYSVSQTPVPQNSKPQPQNGNPSPSKNSTTLPSLPSFHQSKNNPYSGPRKEINILVLGETGVGKSTWINGIANYMSFDHIVDALGAPEPICVIPSKFTMCDENYQQREIVIGNSANEVFGGGQSATQDARTYLFPTPKYDVYIIDTPGIGDVRGIEQDKENTRKILNAIAAYKNLHAICILFKSNDARMTLSFRYCIGELLLQLHKDAAKNIVFFFTNARGTFYKPGDTIVPLRAFLDELRTKHAIQVALDRSNIFCLDNEAFKFVCAYHDGVEFSEDDMKNFEASWAKSAGETHRFLDYAAECKPHSVDKTLSVNQARGIILQLAKPLADINDLIETNIKVYNDRKVEIENTAATINDLQQKLLIPQIGIKVEELNYPRTVCTGAKCIETQSIPNSEQLQTIYKQICHDDCQLDNVDPERFPEPHLQQCFAMQGGQDCTICGCLWSTHMHIRFKQVKTNESIEDVNIKNAIQTNEDGQITKQKIIESCEKIVQEYKAEQKTLMEASIRFAVFLKQNAIMTFNDVFEKYVEKSIEEEEKCIKAGGDRVKLANLKRCLDEYRQERAAIEHALQTSGNEQQHITTEDVKNMKTILFALPHFGAKLKELFQQTVRGFAMNQQQSVQKFVPPTFTAASSGGKKSVLDKLRRIFSK